MLPNPSSPMIIDGCPLHLLVLPLFLSEQLLQRFDAIDVLRRCGLRLGAGRLLGGLFRFLGKFLPQRRVLVTDVRKLSLQSVERGLSSSHRSSESVLAEFDDS